MSDTSSEHRALAIPLITIKVIDMDVQERAKGWGQVDLLMEEILAQTLYELHLHIIEEIN